MALFLHIGHIYLKMGGQWQSKIRFFSEYEENKIKSRALCRLTVAQKKDGSAMSDLS